MKPVKKQQQHRVSGSRVFFPIWGNRFICCPHQSFSVFYHCTVRCLPESIWKLQFNCRVCNRCLCKRSPAVDGKLDIYLCTINLIVIFQACMTTNGMEKSSVLCVFVYALLCEWVHEIMTMLSWWYARNVLIFFELFFFALHCSHRFLYEPNKEVGVNNRGFGELWGVILLFVSGLFGWTVTVVQRCVCLNSG